MKPKMISKSLLAHFWAKLRFYRPKVGHRAGLDRATMVAAKSTNTKSSDCRKSVTKPTPFRHQGAENGIALPHVIMFLSLAISQPAVFSERFPDILRTQRTQRETGRLLPNL
jgi:hypothetical protein